MRFILEKCKLIHLGKTNPKHSMRYHSAELGRTATLRAAERACAASDFSGAGLSVGSRKRGLRHLGTQALQVYWKEGLRSPLLSWLDSDPSGSRKEKGKGQPSRPWPCALVPGFHWWLPRITPHKASLGPRKALYSLIFASAPVL